MLNSPIDVSMKATPKRRPFDETYRIEISSIKYFKKKKIMNFNVKPFLPPPTYNLVEIHWKFRFVGQTPVYPC